MQTGIFISEQEKETMTGHKKNKKAGQGSGIRTVLSEQINKKRRLTDRSTSPSSPTPTDDPASPTTPSHSCIGNDAMTEVNLQVGALEGKLFDIEALLEEHVKKLIF